MGRYLAFCMTCDTCFIVSTNGFGAVISYEEIPKDQQNLANSLRLQRPHSELYQFGGCSQCGKPGWPQMEKVLFQGLPH